MTDKRYFSIEEIISLPSILATAISDDGKKVAYVKRVTNWDGNEYLKHVWIYDKEQQLHCALTTGKNQSTSPRWSPDSQNIAYLMPVGEGNAKKDQIFVKMPDQLVGVQITNAPEGVATFAWMPDGSGFVYLAQVSEADGMKKRKEVYGDFEHVDKEYQYNALYCINIEAALGKMQEAYSAPRDIREKVAQSAIQSSSQSVTEKMGCAGGESSSAENLNDSKGCQNPQEVKNATDLAIQLTDGKSYYIRDFAISPDSHKVVFRTTPTPNDEDSEKTEVYLLDLQSKSCASLNIGADVESHVLFSPDSKKICYARLVDSLWFNNCNLEIMDLATGTVQVLPSPFDEYFYLIRWTERGIFVEWQNRINAVYGFVAEEGQYSPLIEGEDCYAIYSAITLDGQHVVYLKANSEEPLDVYLDDERITDRWKIYADKVRSKKQTVRWASHDGTEIEGILTTPPDFDEHKQYPLVLVVHGGPTGTSLLTPTADRYYPIEQFVAKGFIVLEPNYRGSAGYGEAFRKLNVRNLGVGDYADIISGVDALIERGFVDSERVGVMGWSQGGYISAFCSTYSDRFKAISVGAGISNWVTYYLHTDIHQFTRMYLADNPWNDPEIYRVTSPMTYIKNACTPTLIQHGDNDTRVPVANAYELYQGLRDMNVPVELVIYKGMGHSATKPGQARAIMTQNLLWFCHHILGESLEGFYLNT